MQQAWNADAECRPDSETLYKQLKSMLEEYSTGTGRTFRRGRKTPDKKVRSQTVEPVSVALKSMGDDVKKLQFESNKLNDEQAISI